MKKEVYIIYCHTDSISMGGCVGVYENISDVFKALETYSSEEEYLTIYNKKLTKNMLIDNLNKNDDVLIDYVVSDYSSDYSIDEMSIRVIKTELQNSFDPKKVKEFYY